MKTKLTFNQYTLMRKLIFVLSGAFVALTASVSIHASTTDPLTPRATPAVPTDMYVEPGTHSCVVTWSDEENSAWNLRYRLYSEEPEEPVLLHSLTGSAYTGSYADITLPAPWGGVNTRAGNGAIYVKNNYNGVERGYLTYTIPEGYTNATFTLMIKSGSGSYGVGNFTVYTPQTAAVGHNFSGGETYRWLVTASSGEKITVYSTDADYSPDIALIAVYWGDATGSKARAIEWTYVNNLNKTTYTIENLEIDTEYEVQVQAIGNNGATSDWCRPDVFRTLAEEPFVTQVHILGDIDDQAWAPDAGTKMVYDPEDETYTATIHVEENRTFGFSTELDMDDLGGWNYLLPYRFGPVCDDAVLSLTDENLGRRLPLTFDNYGDLRVLSDGDYKVTVSLEESYVIVEQVGFPVHGYELGDVNHSNSITIKDVTELIALLLGSSESACPICADVTQDEALTIKDVTELIAKLLESN